MNPQTYQFEPITAATPDDWSKFTIGEHFTLKGIRFRVVEINTGEPEHHLVLVPDKPDAGEDAKATSYARGLEDKLRRFIDRNAGRR